MTPSQHAAALADLEIQLAEVATVTERLDHARTTLMPEPAGFWRGAAHTAYVKALARLEQTVDAGLWSLREARESTTATLARLEQHG